MRNVEGCSLISKTQCFIFRYAMIGYASAGAFIFMLYIIFDTQMLMGGHHSYALDPEEYVFAALSLYLDMVNLFIYILAIVGLAKD